MPLGFYRIVESGARAMNPRQVILLTIMLSATMLLPAAAQQALGIVVQSRQFAPTQLHVTADAPFTLKVTNLDANPIEFASAGMRVDRIVSPNTSVLIDVAALPRGRYTFVDVMHGWPQGVLIID
ncbi:cupredoxin domain-containing protein [Microbacteriaceae bacterium K1510]|nr:cupredoxin domain-containing protein [Microbacteriaceae bacterium K1510]